jgi:DNA helicase-2/ATP-dependent DNA helicase PcrA
VFSENDIGDRIKVSRAFSDNEEGKIVAEAIMQERSLKGLKYNDFAILYRTNAQSRAMEEGLRKLNIPYKIYGGLSFYQRKEIKDLIAYFRLTFNPNDEEALKRVINYPRRGIGDTTVERIMIAADKNDITLWQVLLDANKYLDARSSSALNTFTTMVQSFQVMARAHSAYDTAMHIAQHSGVLKDLYDDKSVEGLSRHENIQELLNGIKEFSEREDIEEKGLDIFMQDVALLTNDDNDKTPDADTVSLLTIHSAKGLEYSHVFVVGLEENLFPSQMSLGSREDLEEERRLFYVAITRARNTLSLCYATSRYRWGTLTSCEPSRFIDEINPKYLELDFRPQQKPSGSPFFDEERSAWQRKESTSVKRSIPAFKTTSILPKAHVPTEGFAPSDTSNLQVGMEVEHERFGFGKVISLEGNKGDVKATIFFKELGNKQLLLKFAKLRIIYLFLILDRIRIFVLKIRIMTTKLTLTVEKDTIEKAKVYARETGRSLSELIENYLESLIQEHSGKEKLSPRLAKIVGSVKLPEDFDEKKELDSYFENKHL